VSNKTPSPWYRFLLFDMNLPQMKTNKPTTGASYAFVVPESCAVGKNKRPFPSSGFNIRESCSGLQFTTRLDPEIRNTYI
jgi:hypothetical protein